MNNWRMKLYKFMQGRYGADDFGKFLLIAGLVLLFVSNFFRTGIVHLLGLAVLVYAYVRIVSKNIPKRQRENEKFLNIKSVFSRAGSGKKWPRRPKAAESRDEYPAGNYGDTENYNYYRCRNCGQIVRVPKGKGSVKITCPECGNSFVDRT